MTMLMKVRVRLAASAASSPVPNWPTTTTSIRCISVQLRLVSMIGQARRRMRLASAVRSRSPCPPDMAERRGAPLTCSSARLSRMAAADRRNSMKIGILTGGGDVPGLNACIRSVVLSADDLGWEVLGFRRGWDGVTGIDPADAASVAEHTLPLSREAVRGIDRTGGTILHTSRSDPRTHKDGDQTAHVIEVLQRLGIEAMITLGGDGTLRFSAHLAAQSVPVISVPKTMDNDVFGTDYCIGFSTAVSRSVEAINALRTTIESHERVGVVELFGRRSGETALLSGFLAQVDRTIIAEVPADLNVLLPLLAEDQASNPAHYAMCVISEGAAIKGEADDGAELSKPASERGETGIGQQLGRAIKARLGFGTVIQELASL